MAMNQITKLIAIAYLVLFMLPVKIFCQDKTTENSENEKLIVAAREIMKEAGNCALITLNDQSIPMVRIMDPFPPESDFTVWFGTKSESRKVGQIKNNPTVTLYYQDRDVSGYVVIHGNAIIVDDKKEIEKRWKVAWEAFYPNNREGYILIKVTPDWMEILSLSRGIVGDPVTWQVPIVRFD